MDLNYCAFTGHLGKDVKVYTSGNGIEIAEFRLAVHQNYRNGQGELVEKTTWIYCKAFDNLARIFRERTQKGSFIRISGTYENFSYIEEDTDVSKTVNYIKVLEVQFLDRKNK